MRESLTIDRCSLFRIDYEVMEYDKINSSKLSIPTQ